jgi:chromosome partitioning protein
MTFANTILVPLKADYLSLHGLVTLFSTYKTIKNYLNNDLTISGIVITMFNNSTKICSEIEIDVRKNLENLVFKTKIPQNVRITESTSYGMPINYYDPKSIGAIKYREFVDEFIDRNNKVNSQED